MQKTSHDRGKQIAATAFAAIKGFVERSLKSFEDRLFVLENHAPEKGERGEKGDKGDSVEGERGLTGAEGSSAYAIAIELGFDGTEDEWLASLKGDTGPAGVAGERGATGDTGPAGVAGEQGSKGDQGETGPEGPAGKAGEPGIEGKRGQAGERGDVGPKGEKGDSGLNGEAGERGEKGIAGEQGAKGDVGPKGDQGEAGLRGEPGERGEKGDVGDRGLQGLQGEKGLQGDRGEVGTKGEDGRDAWQIEILDKLDVERAYARATFASWRGGLVRSFRNTDPLEKWIDGCSSLEEFGWTVLINGIDVTETKQVNEREFVTHIRTTDGRVSETRAKFSVMIYREVWKQGEYSDGDVVTRDGSLWIAVADTSGRPGDSKDWRLAVKHGRNGKDGKDGDKGERGLDGRPGKDLTRIAPDGSRY